MSHLNSIFNFYALFSFRSHGWWRKMIITVKRNRVKKIINYWEKWEEIYRNQKDRGILKWKNVEIIISSIWNLQKLSVVIINNYVLFLFSDWENKSRIDDDVIAYAYKTEITGDSFLSSAFLGIGVIVISDFDIFFSMWSSSSSSSINSTSSMCFLFIPAAAVIVAEALPVLGVMMLVFVLFFSVTISLPLSPSFFRWPSSSESI